MMKLVSKFDFISCYHMSRLEIRTSIIVVEEINIVNRSQYRSVYLNYRKFIVFWFNGSMIYK